MELCGDPRAPCQKAGPDTAATEGCGPVWGERQTSKKEKSQGSLSVWKAAHALETERGGPLGSARPWLAVRPRASRGRRPGGRVNCSRRAIASARTPASSASGRSLVGSRRLHKTPGRSVRPRGYADPGVTPGKPALKTRARVKRKELEQRPQWPHAEGDSNDGIGSGET